MLQRHSIDVYIYILSVTEFYLLSLTMVAISPFDNELLMRSLAVFILGV